MPKTAEQNDIITNGPFRGIFLFRETHKTRVLSKEEEEKRIAAANPPLKQFIIVGLQTAARSGELAGLKWKDIDTEARTIRLERTKTDKGRVVPLNQKALAAI